MSGLVHLYTGDGKGKTTAALGLALRALGRGKRVAVVQFCKGRDSGECKVLAALGVPVWRNSRDYGFYAAADEDTRAAIRTENNANLEAAVRLMAENACDLLILDEAAAAYTLGAVDTERVDWLLGRKRADMELVLTGRDAPASFRKACDYVSEIRAVRHPYDRGIQAREGIEY